MKSLKITCGSSGGWNEALKKCVPSGQIASGSKTDKGDKLKHEKSIHTTVAKPAPVPKDVCSPGCPAKETCVFVPGVGSWIHYNECLF